MLRSALLETPLSPQLEPSIALGASAKFPISAQDLLPFVQGAALGHALKTLEAEWIASRFQIDKQDLIERLPDIR